MSHTAPQPSSDQQKGHSVAYRIVRGMFVVLFFWLFWKFGGFLLNAVVGRVYGAGPESDAYFFAAQSVVFLLIFSRLMAILVPSFTPVFIEEKNERGEEAAWDFASTVINLLMVGAAIVMLIFYVYAEPITDTLVRGFGDEARALGIRLLRWILPGAALMMLYLPVRAVLNSYKVFSYPSAAEAAQKLIWAVGLYVTYRFLHLGVLAVAAGFLTGTAGLMAISLFGIRRYAGHYRLRLPGLSWGRLLKETLIGGAFVVGTIAVLTVLGRSLPEDLKYRDIIQLSVVLAAVMGFTGQIWYRARGRDGVMARFATLAAPLLVSTVFAAYRDVITYYFQSFAARGVFSDIEFARRIVFVPTTVVAYALSVAMFPYLCELASKKDHAVLGNIVTKATRMLALGFVPLTVMTIILAGPVSRLVLDRGTWAPLHLRYTAVALALLAIGLIIYAWEYIIMQGYYSLQRMWAPALMGIIATIFQFSFLAIPIYGLGYDYPVQIFFLAALAYPVSRYFKNLILLVMLRRHVPILPPRETALFGLKLLILTAGMGGATWVGHRWMQKAAPFEQYRQHKVVVDNFETGPDTWFSLNAADIGLTEAPGEGRGIALQARYNRHGETRCSIYRKLTGIRTGGDLRLEFAVRSANPAGQIAVELETPRGRRRILETELQQGEWTQHGLSLSDAAEAEKIHWLEIPGPPTENTLYLDDVRLLDAESGRILWSEDFDSNGWSAPGTTLRTENTQPEADAPRYALRIPAQKTAARDLSGFDFSDTSHFRCRLFNPGEDPSEATVTLSSPEATSAHTAELPPGEWKTVDVSHEKMAFESAEQFAAIERIEIQTTAAPLYLDDVTVRRPPQGMYEVVKLVHCVVATLAGILVGALLVPLLRFEEMEDVIQWVKSRGWKKSKQEVEEELEE